MEWIDFFLLRDLNVRMVVLGSILLGIGSAAIGCFAFLRKRALVGDAVAHAALPGVAVAFMLTGTKSTVWLLLGAAVSGWVSMVAMDYIVRRSRIREDAAIGIVLSVFFGLGILLMTHIQAGGSANQSGLDKFLFGQAASMMPEDVMVFGTVSLVLVAVIVIFYKEFKLLSFDLDFARVLGFPVRMLELLLTTLIVLAVVVGIQAVGVVLMAAMLITPAAAARYWTERLPVMIILASLFGAVSGVAGAFVSYIAPRMPTGPWIVTAITMIFVISLLAAPRRGVLARIYRHRSNQRRTAEENVLKAMHHLAEKDGEPRRARSMEEIRTRRQIPDRPLKRALGRLRSRGYVSPDGDGRWILTPEGSRRGERITRLHRLWEVYLTDYVQIAPDHVHDDAESIEHVLTPELEQELERLLNRPASDPHERTIPYH